MILAMDTSGLISVAMVDSDRTVAHRSEYAPRHHSELLASMVKETLAKAGCPEGGVSAVVVGTGPAPFTGLRVGLMTARMLARAWGVQAYGWCSLDAVGAAHDADVTVVSDARRKEVYWATYSHGERMSGPHVSRPQDVEVLGRVLGRGALLYPDVFPDAALADPDPAWLARIIAKHRELGVDSLPTTPLYLRRPDVHGG